VNDLACRSRNWTDASGAQIHYAVQGHGPEALVMVHELGGSLDSWDPLAELLDKQFRVIRFDQRGHGMSEKLREATSLERHAADLTAVLDTVGCAGGVWLVGAAAGSAIAVQFASKCPQRVNGLILCAPALVSRADQKDYLLERSSLAEREGMRAIVDSSLERSYPTSMACDDEAFKLYRSRMLANDPQCYANANRVVAGLNLAFSIASLATPTLLIGGQHDLVRPKDHVREVSRTFRQAEFVEINSGHLMGYYSPTLVAQEIRRFVALHSGAHTI
jgi:3-oxoadipate enol-lactonase